MPALVTKRQLIAIGVCRRELRLSEENYRSFLSSRCTVDSAKNLTRQQATELIKHWNNQLGRKSSPRRRPGLDERLPNDLVTKAMSSKIKELLVSLGYDENTGILDARVIIKKQCGQAWPQTREQGNKVIEGLKAMLKRGWKATHTKDSSHA